MQKLILALSFTAMAFTGATASADYSCKWTAESSMLVFATDPVYSAKPMIDREACAGADAAPSCTGFVYCLSSTGSYVPPQALTAACKAVKVGGTWKCPKANDCAKDDDVQVVAMSKVPSTGPDVPGGDGDGSGMREGQGGR